MKQDNYVYIAGPMSGIDNNNKTAFMLGQRRMELYFNKECIFNPAISEETIKTEHGDFKTEQEAYRVCLKADLAWICDYATHMYMLEGWENSKGARTEHALAVALGLTIYYET